MYKKIALVSVCSMFVLFANPVFSQIDTVDIVNPDQSEDVILDNVVDYNDVEAEEANILPDSFFYRFKRLGRAAQRFVTFDPIKKAELEIKHADQELLDVQKMVQEKGHEEDVERSMKYVEKRLSQVAKHAEKLADTSEDEQRDVMKRLLDSEIKRQKVFEHLEDRIEDDSVREHIQFARDRVSSSVGDVAEEIPFDEQMIEEVLIAQRGSDFKDLRNLEVLKRVEGKVPEQAKEAIRRAQENTLRRVARQAEGYDEDTRERFTDYLGDFHGDHVLKFEILDELEGEFDEGDFRDRVKKIRDHEAVRFAEKFEEINNIEDEGLRERMHEHMLKRFSDEDPLDDDHFERLDRFRSYVPAEELRQELNRVEEEEIGRFLEAFPDAQADVASYKQKTEEMRRAVEAGDITKIKLLEKAMKKLQEEVKQDPEKRAFLEQFENANKEARRGFVDYLEREDQEGFDKFTSDDPEHLEFLRGLREDLADDQSRGDIEGYRMDKFDRVFNEQMRHMTDEQRRRAQAFEEDEKEFRQFSDQQRREYEEEYRKKLSENITEEERERFEEEFRRHEEELESKLQMKEKLLFGKQLLLECHDDDCFRRERDRFEAGREDGRIRLEADQNRRQERTQYREEDRRMYEKLDEMREPDAPNLFRGDCRDRNDCMSWCEEHKDDPKCLEAGAREEEMGFEDTRRDDFTEEFLPDGDRRVLMPAQGESVDIQRPMMDGDRNYEEHREEYREPEEFPRPEYREFEEVEKPM